MKAILALLILASAASADPLKKEDVPAPLQPWVSWVLRGHESEACTAFQGQGTRECAWPGQLSIALEESGGRFEQSWRLDAEDWAFLPGDQERWPLDVRVGGAPAAVVERGGQPALRLKAGTHKVTGAFRWNRMPEQLKIPNRAGMLALSVSGKPVPLPVRDDGGRLWLQTQQRAPAPKEESRLDVLVHRRLMDEVPLQLLTRVQLKVSGANREAVLGRVLPEGFSPMSLVSALPARLDPDGRLRVQVRSGTWELMLAARRETPGDEVKLPEPRGPWAADEAWVFDARPDLRQAEVAGAPALDPAQTELPPDWKRLPAYLVKPGTGLKLVQRRRGDDPPAPDRLTLSRELWLDFDGKGFSVRDRLQGTLGRSWRLESSPEATLGRVSAGGADQFLTSLASGAPAGLEVRTRSVDIEADSRVEGRALTAAGWKHDVESLDATLHLPPGWRLLHASGADQATPTWVSQWTLLDFFLVLIGAAAFFKLYGRAWGAAALLALALLWHEESAPRGLWLAVLFFVALARVLDDYPDFARWMGRARMTLWVALAVLCLPFLVNQLRTAVYPALELPYNSVTPRGGAAVPGSNAALDEMRDDKAMPAPAAPPLAGKAAPHRGYGGRGMMGVITSAASSMAEPEMQSALAASARGPGQRDSSFYNAVLYQMRLDPLARVTTGPGLPYWNWGYARLTWRGPVPQGHRLSLWLVPPCVNFFLALLRVALTVLLAVLLGGFPVGEWLESLRGPEGRARLARLILPLALLAALAPGARAAEAFPPDNLLNELRSRLLEAPACAPFCAQSPRLKVEATPTWLKLTLEIHAAAATAVPVPSGGREWTAAKGTLDGAPAHGVTGDYAGALWVPVTAGAHVLVLEGPLPDRDSIQLALPLKPRRVEASVSGWTLNGLRPDGGSEANLQLSRSRGTETAAAATAAARAQGVFPPFLRVERILRLGLSWSVETHVVRLTPTGAPVVVQVPVLPGESVTTPDVRVVNGKVQASLAPQAAMYYWSSSLPLGDAVKLTLTAPAGAPWTESWRVEPGPLWHVSATGFPPVYQAPDAGARARAFRPWPGESVALSITRPGAVVGRTLTVDESELTLSPGVRSTDAALRVSLRTSRGDRAALTLPEGAELLSAKVDGALQPLRLEQGKLSLPVAPGAHSIEADWRQPGGASLLFRAPAVSLGAESVNSHVTVMMPAGRWTLLLGGRGLGPAVLFWSVLAVFLLASVGLSKTGLAPLTWTQWLLLSVGLTQVAPALAAFVAGWFLAMGLRGRGGADTDVRFNLMQAGLGLYTLLAAAVLFGAIKRGLLGAPDMQVTGNGSSAEMLRWYLDRAGASLPRPWVFSVPLGAYRAAMLGWALWLANSVLTWARWAWTQFSTGGLWKKKSALTP